MFVKLQRSFPTLNAFRPSCEKFEASFNATLTDVNEFEMIGCVFVRRHLDSLNQSASLRTCQSPWSISGVVGVANVPCSYLYVSTEGILE